jgi:hypothetical protein
MSVEAWLGGIVDMFDSHKKLLSPLLRFPVPDSATDPLGCGIGPAFVYAHATFAVIFIPNASTIDEISTSSIQLHLALKACH